MTLYSLIACRRSITTHLHHLIESSWRVHRYFRSFILSWIIYGMRNCFDHKIHSHQAISPTRINLIYTDVILDVPFCGGPTPDWNCCSFVLWHMSSTLHLQQFIKGVANHHKTIFRITQLYGGKFHIFVRRSVNVYLSKAQL